MTDPIQGASAAMQSIQKLQQSSVDGAGMDPSSKIGQQGATQGPSFKEVMQERASQVEQTQGVQAPEATNKADALPPANKTEATQRLDNFVKGVFKDEAKINRMMQRCARGKTLEQGELLQLQGLIYSYGQKIDLASKLVDKATGGVKQIMNTQV